MDVVCSWLVEGDCIVDCKIVEIVWIILLFVDMGLSVVSFLLGEGDLGDVFIVVSLVLIVGVVGKFGKVVLCGWIVVKVFVGVVKEII